MKLTYTVHSVHETTESVPMMIEGMEAHVVRPIIIVELVNDGHGHTFRFQPQNVAELERAQALFVEGHTITISFDEGV